MITYNKARIITVEVFKLYGQKDGVGGASAAARLANYLYVQAIAYN